jgi:putative SbcD/Mre11-related phosphoesterase
MEIIKGIEIKGKALWIKKEKALIIGDSHIGYEEALAKQGFLVPRSMFLEMKKDLKELLKLKPELVIINGDLKHEFGEISIQEWQEALEIIDMIPKTSKIILIKGNHDKILEPIARKRDVEVRDFLILGENAILHGHKMLIDEEIQNKKVKTIIIGHEHPAISIQDNLKREKFKCFLKGKWHGKNLIVMPSFFLGTEGSDVKTEKLFSPFLKEQKIGNFEVFIVGDKTYRFGKVKDI